MVHTKHIYTENLGKDTKDEIFQKKIGKDTEKETCEKT